MVRIYLCLLVFLLPGGAMAQNSSPKTTVFAGGCFWCMEPPFDKQEGVISTVSGFAGGHVANPTYNQVTAGGTGHLEVVQITYDPAKVSIETLLEIYWANVDPIDAGGQFCDRGESYTTAVFYTDEEQKEAAQNSKLAVTSRLGKDTATKIVALDQFYPAEDYHQDYYEKNPLRYKYYRWGCGRDARLKEVWGESAGKHIALFN
tara:strand:- start:466 stop:1077 length:612 start_codon:yes stop_codon:yes gene_type:complete